MSNLATTTPDIEPFIPHPDKSTIIPMKETTNTITISNEQFQELLSRRGNKPAIGNPGALGLGAFALTTFILSVFNTGEYFLNKKLEPVVLPVALFYGGLAQFLAGMWEFKINNTFGATAFTSYGAFWMSFAGYVHIILPRLNKIANTEKATGLFLLAWFIFTIIMNVAAVKVSKFLCVLFTALNITFLLLVIGNLAKLNFFINIGGWAGIITAFIAWYGCAAIVINTSFKRQILPLGVYV